MMSPPQTCTHCQGQTAPSVEARPPLETAPLSPLAPPSPGADSTVRSLADPLLINRQATALDVESALQLPPWASTRDSSEAYAKYVEKDIKENRIGNFCAPTHPIARWTWIMFSIVQLSCVACGFLMPEELFARSVVFALVSAALLLFSQYRCMRFFIVFWKSVVAGQLGSPFKLPVLGCDCGFCGWFIAHNLVSFVTIFFKMSTLCRIGDLFLSGLVEERVIASLLLIAVFLSFVRTAIFSIPTPVKVHSRDDRKLPWIGAEAIAQTYTFAKCTANNVENKEEHLCTWAEVFNLTSGWCSTHYEILVRLALQTCMSMVIAMSSELPLAQLKQIKRHYEELQRQAAPVKDIMKALTGCQRRGQLVVKAALHVVLFNSMLSTLPKLALQVFVFHHLSVAERDQPVPIGYVVSGYLCFFMSDMLDASSVLRACWTLWGLGGDAVQPSMVSEREAYDEYKEFKDAKNTFFRQACVYFAGISFCFAIVVSLAFQSACDFNTSQAWCPLGPPLPALVTPPALPGH